MTKRQPRPRAAHGHSVASVQAAQTAQTARKVCEDCAFSQLTECRRFPAVPLMGGQAWPRIAPSLDWCGEFKPKA